MKRWTVRLVKIITYPVLTVAGLLALYLGVAWTLARIPVAPEPVAAEAATVPFFIHSNGVHTDLVMPVKSPYHDWSRDLPWGHLQNPDSVAYQYVGLGWGDRGFYLDTPTWGQLKPRTAVQAGFWLGSSLLHATYFKAEELRPSPQCINLKLTPAQYRRLIAYVQQGFRRDSLGRTDWVAGHSYGPDDAFYEANGRYSFAHTCNSWANTGLKEAGQKASLWTPFESGIFRHYQ